MDIRILKAFIFIFLTMIGIPGNLYIIIQFFLIRVLEKRLLPSNIILLVLAFANLLIVCSRVIPQSLNALGIEDLMDNTNCKMSAYTYRVSRAMSICTTSLLSCHQCILIAPSTKIWVYLKQKVSHNISPIILGILLMNLVIYRTSFMYGNARSNNTSPYTLHLVYCDTDFQTYVSYIANGVVFASRDFLFVAMMALASFYIVYVLLRHEKTVKSIRSLNKAKSKSVEYKASRAVILLVICYVVFMGLDNSMWIYTLTLVNVKTDMNDARVVLACAYSAVSPFIIIVTNPRLQQCPLCRFWRRLQDLPSSSSFDIHLKHISI
ncbi:PREDICTED: vomeronasal type-1 receptor 1-like [Nanorana parkeri]|uniref:vomeronasal type-1 receptor 1-like n=1 Tax=Nanorana parkeri TaxID=125878 RepID=UPI00085414EF|nr:PREDICTED: vomeronasal type-1 receptor 1-like [Nanorana parkeri]